MAKIEAVRALGPGCPPTAPHCAKLGQPARRSVLVPGERNRVLALIKNRVGDLSAPREHKGQVTGLQHGHDAAAMAQAIDCKADLVVGRLARRAD
jgi:hypothetical protein